MKQSKHIDISMFSKETLSSLEMAEILGGDDNTNCQNTSCTNEEKCTDKGCSNNNCNNSACAANTTTSKSSSGNSNSEKSTDNDCRYNDKCVFNDGEQIYPLPQTFCFDGE
ncbi:MAG: hypothetical protein IJ748_07820 [Bacteroidales bacterium]|nr:hypothetical protein [Bacteroidales bacterium]